VRYTNTDAGNAAIARATYEAYATGNRVAIEALVAADFTFTSPLDNGLDRKTYFERCWPNSRWISGFEFVRLVPFEGQVLVTYEARSLRGTRFRNTEILTIRDGQVTAAEVYFGWSVPHEAPTGGFVTRE
jgi:ketosteroid isomerase-like protein